MIHLGALAGLAADPAVSDIGVNGDGRVWIERAGTTELTALRLPTAEVELLVERIVSPLGLRADRNHPIVDARLPDGSRVHAVVPPAAVDGPCLAIRRFAVAPLPVDAFGPPEAVGPVVAAVERGGAVLVSGGTGTGKTTLLNALGGLLPASARVVTVEDAAELRLGHPNVVRLEARPPNAEGAGGITLRQLVRSALRLRPDRLVVGEVRGGEAFELLQAMNTGHEGTLSTVHANGPDDALARVEALAMLGETGLPHRAIRAQLRAALDLVVHLRRGPGGGRLVSQVAAVPAGAGRLEAVYP